MTAGAFSRRVSRLWSRRTRRDVRHAPIDFGPLNGQAGRQALVEEILALCQPQAIIETGTYLGTTSKWFAERTSVPILTVESHPDRHKEARAALQHRPHVHAVAGDSRDLLRSWAGDAELPNDNCFFYLDAHWNQDLPLVEELDVIVEHFVDPIIMVDDFEVPGDEGYGFDEYGPGRALTLEIIPSTLRTSFVPLFPTLLSSHETGYRRGTVVLVQHERAALLMRSGRLAPAVTET